MHQVLICAIFADANPEIQYVWPKALSVPTALFYVVGLLPYFSRSQLTSLSEPIYPTSDDDTWSPSYVTKPVRLMEADLDLQIYPLFMVQKPNT